jgi:hypothetical protein
MTAAEAESQEFKSTFCYETHAKIAALEKQSIVDGKPDTRLARVIEEFGDFFLDETAKLDPRPKTSVIGSLTNSIYPFLSGTLKDLFCTTSTISPFGCREGEIHIFDLSAAAHGAGGITSQVLLKLLYGLAWQSRPVDAETRPVFVAADEAQFVLAGSDADLLSTGRSSKISICYATQDLPTYFAKISGPNSQDVTDSILAKFGTHVYHSNSCVRTNQHGATQVGKVEKFHVGESRSHGSSAGAGGDRHDAGGAFSGNHGASTGTGQSTSGYLDWEIPPEYFSKSLRTGGPKNRYKVDAIIVRHGRIFEETGKHWVKAEFDQK